jgi:phage gp46-like protein
MILLNI